MTTQSYNIEDIESIDDINDIDNTNKADGKSLVYRSASGNMEYETPSGGGGGLTSYMYPVWAEENSGLGNSTYEWAFGNGANTPSNCGMCIYIPTGWAAEIVAMSATTNSNSGSSVIEANINGVLQGSNCNVTISGRSGTNDNFSPVTLSNADRLTFRTTTAGTNSSPSVVCAWIRMTPP